MVQSGDAAEVIVAGRLMEMGYPVSKPLGDNEPYDLVVDIHGDLLKVQVKRMHKKNDRKGSIRSLLTKHGSEISQGRGYYESSEVDAFALYYDGGVYWAWFDETPDTTITLSLKGEDEISPRHKSRTRLAKDYRVETKLG